MMIKRRLDLTRCLATFQFLPVPNSHEYANHFGARDVLVRESFWYANHFNELYAWALVKSVKLLIDHLQLNHKHAFVH
jgi:hypothetical protein